MLYYYLTNDTASQPEVTDSKILVAYFSATGTTRPLAEYAAEILDADLYEIVPEDPYTEADLDYYTGGRADQEQNDPSARPAISGSVENMADYDVVFLGYPIWHGQPPRIISTFLESYDFTGKTILYLSLQRIQRRFSGISGPQCGVDDRTAFCRRNQPQYHRGMDQQPGPAGERFRLQSSRIQLRHAPCHPEQRL